MMKRTLALVYGISSYLLFFGVSVYGAGFIGGFLTPTRLDAPQQGSIIFALIVDLGLLAIFAIQHSVMARPRFKQWWTQIVPQPVERSTYVLFSSVALFAVFALWQPLGGAIWNLESTGGRIAVYTLFAAGWLIVLMATFLINHFDLFGLRQVWLYFRGRPYTSLRFATPGPYRWVRHPLYIGWMTVFWATPTMTAGHLAFALLLTVYMVAAARIEERDLVAHFGSRYEEYRRKVPMFVPRIPLGSRKSDRPKQEAVAATR
jgi:protein-S-isoprenylcysteine O-methyltransferase Ste14